MTGVKPTILKPQRGPQERFARCSADIAIFGGAAGGGKSYALLFEPLYHVHRPNFSAVIFRESYPQITAPGGLWDTSCALYPQTGAVMHKSDMSWVWKSGAKVKFAHMQGNDGVYAWQGSQIALIGWDELTHHSMHQFFYMLSRNRSICGIRPYIRGTCNPDADSWVADFISWWIDPETGYPIPERAGVLRYFRRINDEVHWVDKDDVDSLGIPPRSVTFIPSKVSDNAILLKTNPDYVANLMSLPLVERERLLEGNWKIRRGAGKVFNRYNFPITTIAPEGGEMVRYWDFAATEQKIRGDDPDATSAVLMQKINGTYIVHDCITATIGPADVEDLFDATTARDVEYAKHYKARYSVRWEVEPGSAGKRESYRLAKKLAGLDAIGIRSEGDKVSRARSVASQVAIQNIQLLAGAWNDAYLTELHVFPDGKHDDRVDATSGAFNTFASRSRTVKNI